MAAYGGIRPEYGAMWLSMAGIRRNMNGIQSRNMAAYGVIRPEYGVMWPSMA